MRKAKVKKAIKKRFKLTASGLLMRRSQGRKHLLAKKSAKQKKRLLKAKIVSPSYHSLYAKLMQGV
jgi:large subunit ribosomal protein L35